VSRFNQYTRTYVVLLGLPGQSGELCEVIGRDFFLDALVDPALRVRVLDQQPRTLDEALSIVCCMEAYSGTTSNAANADEDKVMFTIKSRD